MPKRHRSRLDYKQDRPFNTNGLERTERPVDSTIGGETFIDLDYTILEYINLRTRDYITDILDEVPSGFIQPTDDEEFNIYLNDTFSDEDDDFNLFEEDE